MTATMDPNDLLSMKRYAGIDNASDTITTRLYNTMYGLARKVEGGWSGSIEIVIYLIFFGMFTYILANNNTLYQDIDGHIASAPSPQVKNYNMIFQIMCGVGLLLCIIRIVWSTLFVTQKSVNRIFETIFGLLVWIIFIACLVFSIMIKSQLKDASIAAANTGSTAPGNASALSISNAMYQNQTEYVLSIIGITLSTVFTGYNVYTFYQPDEVLSDAQMIALEQKQTAAAAADATAIAGQVTP